MSAVTLPVKLGGALNDQGLSLPIQKRFAEELRLQEGGMTGGLTDAS